MEVTREFCHLVSLSFCDVKNANLNLFVVSLPVKEKVIKLTNDYRIVYACHECGFYSKEGAGRELSQIVLLQPAKLIFLVYTIILTRLAHPPCDVIEAALLALERCGISRDQLTYIDHSNCTFCK